MGCVNSRPEFPNEIHPNLFTVTTVSRPNNSAVDESSSRDVMTGQLEIAINEIILHRRGHDPVHWPLQYIRRYGFENHLFSFESGRRCESGPGIFTFRCRRARELFLLVQSNVQDARTSPPALTTSAISSRLRSASATSQNQFPDAPIVNGGNNVMGRSLNDYLATDRPTSVRTTNGYMHNYSASPSPGSGIADASAFDDIDGGQVFEEITPLRNSLIVEPKPRLRCDEKRQRLSSARSHTSSAASDRSLTTSVTQHQIQSRPISFEFILSSTSSPQDGDSNAFVSPQQTSGSPPTSPPSFAYYVNVDPPSTSVERPPRKIDSQRHLSADRYPNGAWRPPARSHSLGSPSASGSQHYFDLSNADAAYVNMARSRDVSPCSSTTPRAEDQHRGDEKSTTLDYVTLDIGTGATGNHTFSQRSPRRQVSHNACTNETALPTAGKALYFASSLTSVLEGGPTNISDGSNEEPIGSSNYARIDCTRTKALRETAAAAHIQRQSTSCSASSSEATIGGDQAASMGPRRSRHDSARK